MQPCFFLRQTARLRHRQEKPCAYYSDRQLTERLRRMLFSTTRIAVETFRDRKRAACSRGGKGALAPFVVSRAKGIIRMDNRVLSDLGSTRAWTIPPDPKEHTEYHPQD